MIVTLITTITTDLLYSRRHPRQTASSSRFGAKIPHYTVATSCLARLCFRHPCLPFRPLPHARPGRKHVVVVRGQRTRLCPDCPKPFRPFRSRAELQLRNTTKVPGELGKCGPREKCRNDCPDASPSHPATCNLCLPCFRAAMLSAHYCWLKSSFHVSVFSSRLFDL